MANSYPKRDADDDELLSPENSVLTFIDFQPTQINSVNSINHSKLIKNAEYVAELGKIFKIPIVLSTVNVENGRNKDTIPGLKKIIGEDVHSYDRTAINAWEDKDYNDAIHNTGRQNIIIVALWTEACLTFPTLDALEEGFSVYPVIDAVGGTSTIAHETALRRIEQAGAELTTIPQLACELQRDCNRTDTAGKFVQFLLEQGAFPNTN